jgi:hypothetical protein
MPLIASSHSGLNACAGFSQLFTSAHRDQQIVARLGRPVVQRMLSQKKSRNEVFATEQSVMKL